MFIEGSHTTTNTASGYIHSQFLILPSPRGRKFMYYFFVYWTNLTMVLLYQPFSWQYRQMSDPHPCLVNKAGADLGWLKNRTTSELSFESQPDLGKGGDPRLLSFDHFQKIYRRSLLRTNVSYRDKTWPEFSTLSVACYLCCNAFLVSK